MAEPSETGFTVAEAGDSTEHNRPRRTSTKSRKTSSRHSATHEETDAALMETAFRNEDPMPAARDGRKCKVCLMLDTDSDPVIAVECLGWAYPPKGNRPQGYICFYC